MTSQHFSDKKSTSLKPIFYILLKGQTFWEALRIYLKITGSRNNPLTFFFSVQECFFSTSKLNVYKDKIFIKVKTKISCDYECTTKPDYL